MNDEASDPASEEPVDEDPGWPWSFVLLVVAGGLYLLFRLFDFLREVLT